MIIYLIIYNSLIITYSYSLNFSSAYPYTENNDYVCNKFRLLRGFSQYSGRVRNSSKISGSALAAPVF